MTVRKLRPRQVVVIAGCGGRAKVGVAAGRGVCKLHKEKVVVTVS